MDFGSTGSAFDAAINRAFENATLRTQAENRLRGAQTGMIAAETKEVAPNAASQRGLQGAQAYLATQTGDYVPLDITSLAELRGAQAESALAQGALNRAQAGDYTPYTSDQTRGAMEFLGGLPKTGDINVGDTTRITSKNFSPKPENDFAKGTARVPGKGSGKVDSVPARLAPGEAVLNKAAAEAMGRGLIAALNAAGARKMGMV